LNEEHVMGAVININQAKRVKIPTPDCLLPNIPVKNKEGRVQVKIVCGYISGLFGKYGWTDFIENTPGYCTVYFPKLGFAELCKDNFQEEDIHHA